MVEGARGTEVEGTPVPLGGWDRVFELSPVAMAVVTGGRFLRVNQALCDLVGQSADEIIGQHFTALIGDELIPQVVSTTATVVEGARRVHLEGPIRRIDGVELFVAIDAVIVDDDGELTLVVQVIDLTDLHRARIELSASERRFRALLSNISDTVSILSPQGELLFTTGDQTRESNGLANDVSAFPFSTIHPDDLDHVVAGWAELIADPGREVTVELRVRHSDQTWSEVFVTGLNLVDDPDVGGIVVTNQDVSPLRKAERLASDQARVLELIARGAGLPEILNACVALVERNGLGGTSSIYLLDGDRLEVRAGRAPRALNDFMREPPRMPARSLCDLAIATEEAVIADDISTHPLARALLPVTEALGLRAGWSQPILGIGSGKPVGTMSTIYTEPHTPTAQERQVAELACSLVAIALDRADNEARLAHLALHDSLTGLPNRTLLLDRLDHALARQERNDDTTIAVLFCDLDRFKVVNDSLGHGVGDELLSAFAERLVATVEPGNTVARFGGDEFVVLLEDVHADEDAVLVAERIAAALEQPFLLGVSQEVYLTASIGLTIRSEHQSGDDWLRDADAAMYRAKDRGRNRLELFDAKMRESAMLRLQIENDLRRAVERRELVLHHQPIIDLHSGRICGAEALVRWNHPIRGLLPPDEFISVAEDTGVIEELGRHILDLALSDARRLALRCPSPTFRMGVNVSARQLNNPALDEVIVELCERHGWAPAHLVLEITETALTLDVEGEGPADLLARIQALGVRLAIDDFGTGYSSLARLGQMQVDQVKVDRAFIAAIDERNNKLVRIVDAVVAIAEALGLEVTGEGVETVAQLDHLRRIDCDLAQGYLFSKPLPVAEFESLLAADPRW